MRVNVIDISAVTTKKLSFTVLDHNNKVKNVADDFVKLHSCVNKDLVTQLYSDDGEHYYATPQTYKWWANLFECFNAIDIKTRTGMYLELKNLKGV